MSGSGGVSSQDFWLRERPELRVLFLMFSIEIIGSAMLIAVQAFFMIEDLKMTPLQVGTVLSATAATQMLGAPFSGRISDAYGRRGILILAFFWVGCFQIATSTVHEYIHLLIVRALIGICGGTFAISAAPVLDVEPDRERRSMYMGLFGAIASFAFSFGPALGALLFWSEMMSRRNLFLLAGCFAITSGIIAFFFFKETLPTNRRRPLCGPADDDDSSKSGIGFSDWQMVNLGLSLTWTASCLADFGKFFLYAMYSFLIKDLFGYQDVEFGIILMCCGLLSMIVQAFIFPVIVRLIGIHGTILVSAALTAVGLTALPFATSFFLHFSVLAIFVIGISFWEPGVPVLLGTYASAWHLGAAMGVNFVFLRIGQIASPVVGGWFYEKCGTCSFFVGGASCALSGLLVLLAFFCATEVQASVTEKFEAKYADEAPETASLTRKTTRTTATTTTTTTTTTSA